MSEEQNPVPAENSTENAAPPTPTDFREYVKWRATGEPPEAAASTPAAAEEDTPQAKTEPQSGADSNQQQEDGEQPGDSEDEPIGRRGIQRQRRIDKLVARIEQLERALAANAGSKPPEPPASEPAPPGEPQWENFKTVQDYMKALNRWEYDQREAERQAQSERKMAEEAERKSLKEWDSKKTAARKMHPDFDDAIESAPVPEGPFAGLLRQACLADEAGAEIAYYLAKNPEELKRIAALHPVSAVTELGKIAANFSIPDDAENRNQKVTGAPKPPPSVGRPAKTSADSIFDPAVQRDFRRYAKARARMET